MNKSELLKHWLEEEQAAHIHGWDFSHIQGKCDSEDDLPWDYRTIVKKYLKSDYELLDMDTGGGEFLLSLGHPYERTSATEAYGPNVQLCKMELLPLGITFREADCTSTLPFDENTFDLVINRHGSYNPAEIYRVLKPGGIFITQQVGAENDRDLVIRLFPEAPPAPFPEQYLDIAVTKFEEAGLSIVEKQEAFRPIKFYDVGALVWFAHIIEWEFPDFSVQNNLECLYDLQTKLDQDGVIEGTVHRFLLVARNSPKF
ncbi:MAG: class I SAM-dependent methyltransferase [Lachnoclostridium sp.]|nr:class I SAM-dependent methyltransferase [Lachnoclostridium sp.]